MHLDEARRRLTLSVQEVAESVLPDRFGLQRRASLARMEEGRRAHADYQDAQQAVAPAYEAEAPLRFEFEHRGWTVRVQGRADGLYPAADGRGTVVEELKSIAGPGAALAQPGHPRRREAERQVCLYCLLLERLRPAGGPYRARLVLINLHDGGRRELAVEYSAAATWALLVARVEAVVQEWEADQVHRARQREFAARLAFPFPRVRPGQDEFMATVRAALTEGRDALLAAPAGLGKTVGALYPALQATLGTGRRLFYVTSKNTQQALVADTLRRLLPDDAPVTAVFLRAKDWLCAAPWALCHEALCPYAERYLTRVFGEGAHRRLAAERAVLTASDLARWGRAQGLCPFELALDLTDLADLVVCDYNYVFDPVVALKRHFSEPGARPAALIVDEAHNLPERMRHALSPSLRRPQLAALRAFHRGGRAPFLRELRALLAAADRQFARHASEYRPERPYEPGMRTRFDAGAWSALAGDAERLLEQFYAWRLEGRQRAGPVLWGEAARDRGAASRDDRTPSPLEEGVLAPTGGGGGYGEGRSVDGGSPVASDPTIETLTALQRLGRQAAADGDEFVHVFAREPGGDHMQVLCLDPAPALRRRMRRMRGTVAMSATLAPADFWQQQLGLRRRRFSHRAFASPFDPARRGVFVVPQVSTRYHDRRRDAPRVAATIAEAVAAAPGNYLAFFPSYEYLAMVAALLALPAADWRAQREGMDDAARAALLDFLRARPAGARRLVLAVQGGVFAEGVDYLGDLCHGVLVVGPALPRADFERELMREYFERTQGDGFRYAFLYPGMNRVLQSAGRLIRSEDDAGVLVLLCRRFAGKMYQDCFPADWSDGDPARLIVRDLPAALRGFWATLAEHGTAGRKTAPGRSQVDSDGAAKA